MRSASEAPQHSAIGAAPALNPLAQSKYQLRSDWGIAGVARIAADADVLVWVDVFGAERAALRSPGDDEIDADAVAPLVHRHLLAALATVGAPPTVLHAGLNNVAATARYLMDLQLNLGRRTMIAIVADAGEQPAGPDGTALRFAVENQLAMGALIDELASLGIDFSSPESAAACASFTALRGAIGHLITASASAQELRGLGVSVERIRDAASLNSVDAAVVLRSVAGTGTGTGTGNGIAGNGIADIGHE